MANFRVSGSTGPAPRTVWMSPLADRLTVLNPLTFAGNPTFQTLPVPPHGCNFTSQFTPVNSSQGAFTTAPDGTTNTARKIVEDNTASALHWLYGTVQAVSVELHPSWLMRAAGIFKAAERTRFAFAFTHGNNISSFAICGYDLAGGQIAYGPSNYNVNIDFIQKGASITPVGDGWYLCTFDVLANNYGNMAFGIYLDNGSGTAAQSITYSGNGTSGIYGWKHSLLPIQAWSIASPTFFEDFNDLSGVDVNNTKAPGFSFYVDSRFPGWIGQPPQFAYDPHLVGLTINNSVLTIPNQTAAGPIGAQQLTSCVANNYPAGDGTFTGNMWRPPFFIEMNFNIPLDVGEPNLDEPSYWIVSLESVILATRPQGQNYNYALTQFLPWNAGTVYPNNLNQFNWPVPGVPGFAPGAPGTGNLSACTAYIGCLPYNNTEEYAVAIEPIAFGGNFYINTNLTAGVPPPSAPWAAYSYGTDNIGRKQPNFDLHYATAFHTSGELVVPYDPITGAPGIVLSFFDGMFLGGGGWHPVNNGTGGDFADPYRHINDGLLFNIMIGATPAPFPGWNIDWVKVTQ